MKAPVGPPMATRVPPRAEMMKPAITAVKMPACGGTPEAIARLHAAGLRIVMASGDGQATARAIGARLGIDEVHGEMTPEGKVELVRAPIPAETAFRIALSGELDAVVAMIHDQATIPSKLLDWGSAVNTTWGLPWVRTSVDHGVAYAAAKSGEIDHSGMAAALDLARRLTQS